FERSGLAQWASGSATPQGLAPGDFMVTFDGTERPVVALEALEHVAAEKRTPWTQLIYVDCRQLATGDLRRAASPRHPTLRAPPPGAGPLGGEGGRPRARVAGRPARGGRPPRAGPDRPQSPDRVPRPAFRAPRRAAP